LSFESSVGVEGGSLTELKLVADPIRVLCPQFCWDNRQVVGMSGGDVKATSSAMVQDAGDGLSRALTSALEHELLRPLIDIITEYARAPDWRRARVKALNLGEGSDVRCSLLVDSAHQRVLWSDYQSGRVRAMAIGDLTFAERQPGKGKAADTVAGPIAVSKPLTEAAHCLGLPLSIAIEPVTHWPAGTDTDAAARAEADAAGQTDRRR
jgi:hypothetical protein